MIYNSKKDKIKICILSSVPITLWSFYSVLIRELKQLSVDVTIASSPQETLAKFRQQMGCKIFPIKITRKISPFRDILTTIKLVSHFRKEKYDIIHAHTPKAGLVGMMAGWLAGVPNRIFTIHGMPLETIDGLIRTVFRLISKLTCMMATKNLVVSNSLREVVARENICKYDNMVLLGDGTACGIDLDRFNPDKKNPALIHDVRNQYNIPDDAMVIGFVGRLVPDKGINILLRAFEIVEKKADNVYLFLVGGFEQVREAIDSDTVEYIQNNEKIKYSGFVEDVVPYYYAMDLLVLPSKREGFNYVLIEAAATGLATITTRATGCVDGVVEGETGYIVDIGDYENLARKILELIQRPQLREIFGRNGCDRIRQLFNSERLVSLHIQLYEKLYKKSTD